MTSVNVKLHTVTLELCDVIASGCCCWLRQVEFGYVQYANKSGDRNLGCVKLRQLERSCVRLRSASYVTLFPSRNARCAFHRRTSDSMRHAWTCADTTRDASRLIANFRTTPRRTPRPTWRFAWTRRASLTRTTTLRTRRDQQCERGLGRHVT